jgi:hypothetical protein
MVAPGHGRVWNETTSLDHNRVAKQYTQRYTLIPGSSCTSGNRAPWADAMPRPPHRAPPRGGTFAG